MTRNRHSLEFREQALRKVRQRGAGSQVAGRTQQTSALVLAGGRWKPHDLRRTTATMMAELGALPDVIERCLNHVEPSKVRWIYQRASHARPMRDAWSLLGGRLNLLQSRDNSNAANGMTLKAA